MIHIDIYFDNFGGRILHLMKINTSKLSKRISKKFCLDLGKCTTLSKLKLVSYQFFSKQGSIILIDHKKSISNTVWKNNNQNSLSRKYKYFVKSIYLVHLMYVYLIHTYVIHTKQLISRNFSI